MLARPATRLLVRLGWDLTSWLLATLVVVGAAVLVTAGVRALAG